MMKRFFKIVFSILPELILSVMAWVELTWLAASMFTIVCAIFSYNVWLSVADC